MNFTSKAMIEKIRAQSKSFSFLTNGLTLIGAATVIFLTLWSLFSFFNPTLNNSFSISQQDSSPLEKTFYEDPNFSYIIGDPIKNWDEKRAEWIKNHHHQNPSGGRILMVTGSQPNPCENSKGDQILLRFFKNKVDYCRIHGIEIFYNNVLLDPKMYGFWAKYPVIRAAMVANPEAEWIWWVDSDAVFTDMEFKLPLEKYKDHNLVIHGWPNLIYEQKSWIGLNAGVFLIRNCQWSMDLLEEWADMGPQSPNYEKWGKIQKETFKDKLFSESDDQTGLSYLLLLKNKKWGKKIYIENEYYFQGYFLQIIDKFDEIKETYDRLERNNSSDLQLLRRRRHSEKMTEEYGGRRMEYMKKLGIWKDGFRRPFITHFTGCEPCSGKRNPIYSDENCGKGIEKALNFADNQVLRNFGFFRPNLLNSLLVQPLLFNFTS